MAPLEKRLVLDTNVVVGALLWNGPPWQLLEHAIDQGLVLISSPVLMEELRNTLLKPKLARRMVHLGTTPDALFRRYERLVDLVHPHAVPRVVPTDIDDDQVIATAMESQAELIVSGDSDLLRLGRWQETSIVTVRDALWHLGARQTPRQ